MPMEDPQKDTAYFRQLVEQETQRLTTLCDSWDKKLVLTGQIIPEEVQGSIRSVTGQGRLVMKERFSQFSGLVDNCEFRRGERATTITDLLGFWEMIYFQVKDVDRKFLKMSQLEANLWSEVAEQIKPSDNSNKVRKENLARKEPQDRKNVVRAKPNTGLMALIASRRKEHAKNMSEEITKEEPIGNTDHSVSPTAQTKLNNSTEEKQFDGGFFLISSPSPVPGPRRSPVVTRSPIVTRSVGRRTEAVKVDTSRRRSCLVSPFVSQIGKIIVPGGNSLGADNIKSRLFEGVEEDVADEKEVFELAIDDSGLLASVELKKTCSENLGPSAS